jgi:hypothetical protein
MRHCCLRRPGSCGSCRTHGSSRCHASCLSRRGCHSCGGRRSSDDHGLECRSSRCGPRTRSRAPPTQTDPPGGSHRAVPQSGPGPRPFPSRSDRPRPTRSCRERSRHSRVRAYRLQPARVADPRGPGGEHEARVRTLGPRPGPGHRPALRPSGTPPFRMPVGGLETGRMAPRRTAPAGPSAPGRFPIRRSPGT